MSISRMRCNSKYIKLIRRKVDTNDDVIIYLSENFKMKT